MQDLATRPIASVIGGRYVIEGLLGRSKAVATYLVRDERSRTGPARGGLFVLKEVVEPNRLARRRLASSGKRLRRLHHPGVARVHRVFKDNKGGRVFLLAEYIAGQDLDALRRQQPGQRFSWPQAMSVMAPVVEALIFLHRQRPPIVHGDIRPANIVVRREDGRAVLVDLTMERAASVAPLRDAERPYYRAPEHYSGYVDARADVYALATTFYTLATGMPPPDARSRMMGTCDPQEPLRSLAPVVPLQNAQAIERAMALDAGLRFSSVEQFWDALWLPDGDPAPTVPPPGKPKRDPPADRAEEPKDPDATVRLPPLPPGTHRAGGVRGRREPHAERLPPTPPTLPTPDELER